MDGSSRTATDKHQPGASAPTPNKENTMEHYLDSIDLVSMAHIAMDAQTIEGSPASMTYSEIVTAYALAIILVEIHGLTIGPKTVGGDR